MKRVIDFYGNVFVLDSIVAIAHGTTAKKNSKSRNVIVNLRPHSEYIYNPGTEEWELIQTGARAYEIFFGTAKEAAEGFVEMKRFWEEAINIDGREKKGITLSQRIQ